MTINSSIHVYLADQTHKEVQEKIWNLLEIIDQEFVPPLSSRTSTTDMALTSDSNELNRKKSLLSYFQEVVQQNILIACLNNEYAGLMTFKYKYYNDFIETYCPCNYITTLGVFPKYRNQGIARVLYHFILNELPNDLICDYTVTRTWSSNYGHINLLQKLGFHLVATLKNHRGTGIDSVYFATANEY